MEKFLFSVVDPDSNRILDQLSISIRLLQSKPNSREEILDIEEQLRSTILRVKCLDGKFSGSPNCTWNIMIATRPLSDPPSSTNSGSNSSAKEAALQNALTSGQWYVENENLPESLSGGSNLLFFVEYFELSHKSTFVLPPDAKLERTNEPAEMIPVKTVRIAPIQMEAVAYKFG